jgi:alkylation response protein AidB-like acyl-CoA dehydrogenase
MDFNYTAEQEAWRSRVRQWLAANQPPALTSEERSNADDDFLWERLERWHVALYQGRWMGLNWPKEYGGQGATFVEQLILQQELARLELPFGCNILGVIMTGPAIMQWGTEAQKQRYLRPILSGEEIWCEGLSEPGAGSDLGAIQTRAVLQGDYFVVNGQKVWTTLAHRAHFCQLFVRTDPERPRREGLSTLLVDMRSPGVTIRPLRQMTGSSEFNEIFFEDVRVPKENLLGPLNGGWQVLISTLMHERFGIGETLGGTEQALNQLVKLVKATALAAGAAAKDPEIRHALARFAIETAAKRYSGFRSLTRRLKGLPPGPEASIAKLASSELLQRMLRWAGRLGGLNLLLERGSPLAPENDWARRLLGAEMLTIAGGTSAVQRNMIGERILGLPKG